MDKWEYLEGQTSHGSVEIDDYPRKKEYKWNDLGQQGWELTGTFPTGRVIFKRRIPDSPAQTQAQNTSRQPEVDMDLKF